MEYGMTLEEAIHSFYSTGSAVAHRWILQLQNSPAAWTFVWELLNPAKSWEVQFYAANTLHVKIARQLQEVPETEIPSLRNRILETMRTPNTPRVILAKLCQSMAALLANTVDPKLRGAGVIENLAETLPPNSLATLDMFLRVLSAIPTEHGKNSNGTSKCSNTLYGYWDKTSIILQQVFQTYETSTDSDGSAIYLLALECAANWLRVTALPVEFTARIFPHFLVAAANCAPRRISNDDEDEENHMWDVVQECLIDTTTNAELYKRPQLLWQWAREIFTVVQEHGGPGFYGIITALCEIHSRAFLLALTDEHDEPRRSTAQKLIEKLLECSELPGRYATDEKSSGIPFGFWYSLQDDLDTLDMPLEEVARKAVIPVYARLALALLRKSTLPMNAAEAGNAEECELFRCYRQDVSDTFIFCHRVLGEDILGLIGERLSYLDTRPQKWNEVEATLHAFKALADEITGKEYECLPVIINLIVAGIPYAHYPSEVLASACSAIGAYADWISTHPDPWLERVLKLVGLGLNLDSVTSTPASMALKDIARECGPHLAPFAPRILDTIEKTLPTMPLGSGESLRLMYAAGKLLSSLSTLEQQMPHVEATLGLCVTRLRELLKISPPNSEKEVASQLDMITMFFSTLDGTIGKTVLDALLPIFVQIISHLEWSSDDKILESMHTCISRSLANLKNPEIEALPLLEIVTQSYRKHPHPAALKLLCQLILVFGCDTNVTGPVFAEISAHTLSGVAACRSVGGDLREFGDLLEAYLVLLSQLCKKNPKLLYHVPEQIVEMLRCAITCLTFAMPGVTDNASSFIATALRHETFQQFIEPMAQELVFTIAQCAGGVVPSRILNCHAEVLHALKVYYVSRMELWLRQALADDTCLIADAADKEHFVKQIMKCRQKSQVATELKDFSLKCRRPPSLQYLMTTMNLQ